MKFFKKKLINNKKEVTYKVYERNEISPNQTEMFDLVLYLNSNSVWNFHTEKPIKPVISERQYEFLPERLKRFFHETTMIVRE